MNNLKKITVVLILTAIACFMVAVVFILTVALAMKIGMINMAFWVIIFVSAAYFSSFFNKIVKIK